jgi:hypothetical protein
MKKLSERHHVLEFLKSHVIGKSVIAPAVSTHNDNGKLTIAWEEDAVFSNLVETTQGFSFDMITLARGTRYLPGKELIAEGTMNTVRVIRYDMTERLSSGHLIGYSRFISSTNNQPDPFAGTIFLVRMWLSDGILHVDENHVGYADRVAADGSFRSIATDGKYTYSIEHNQLVLTYSQQTFEVDPKTLHRTPTKDEFPMQISREITFPELLQAE